MIHACNAYRPDGYLLSSESMKLRFFALTSKSLFALGISAFFAAVFYFLATVDMRYVLMPVFVACFIAMLFWHILSDRRGGVPLSDIGVVTVFAVVCYTIVPSIQFLLSGMEHTSLSAKQLYMLAPTPEEFSALTWWYVIYLFSFSVSYLVTDSRTSNTISFPKPPNHGIVRIFVLLFVILTAGMFAIERLYGINVYNVYDVERMFDAQDTLLQMPLLFRQFYGIVGHTGVLFIVKLGLLIVIFINWDKFVCRYALYAWLFLILICNILGSSPFRVGKS